MNGSGVGPAGIDEELLTRDHGAVIRGQKQGHAGAVLGRDRLRDRLLLLDIGEVIRGNPKFALTFSHHGARNQGIDANARLPQFAGHGAVTGAQAIENLDLVVQRHVLHVLDLCDGNRAEAARRLGVSRKTIDRKVTAWAE